ncbi:cytochrome c oxidase subunit 3 [Pseudomonas sp. M47T1]|uniref:cytochrome c oxidase subunit 3 n=1 Tax=Pseudomonas sp. M47T1 TaxID=1179778 RepID=UPI0002E6E099|nr:cytochrome c oxidase subunit 3 [Pseudomonas sp. M47T1]
MDRCEARPSGAFVAMAQQREAVRLGMWLFLASEAMMFGSLMLIAWYYRLQHPAGVGEAVAGLHRWLAAWNTLVLITSGLCMTLALEACRAGRMQPLLRGLNMTVLLGLGFLAGKVLEYTLEYREGVLPGFGLPSPVSEPSARLFMNLYFCSTLLHSLHLLIGVGLVLYLRIALGRGWLCLPANALRLEMTGLYWHLVDGIWVLLFPVLYLVGG